ncbi:MAG: hypothetical protein MMC23_006990 [Stictis urceolatum]|nr:hypothetical protein [Stictis urceolata]
MPFEGETEGLLEFLKNESQPTAVAPLYHPHSNDVAYYHHSSGTSSGLPKLIPQSHRAAVGSLPNMLWTGKATFTTTPLYHGGVADCFRAWTSAEMIWLFPGREVPITTANIIKSLNCADAAAERAHACASTVQYFSSVPYVLQMVASDSAGLEKLRDFALVGIGGAALPPSSGDDLVRSGVNLVSRFGSAECGFLMSSHRDYENDKEWRYLRATKDSKLLDFEPNESELFELIVKPEWPHRAKKNRQDGSYATSDIFAPHLTIPDAWRYDSRADSQLTLITGKKFDPAPLEDTIATSPLLRDVLIVGTGEHVPGALLFPNDESREAEEIIEMVWPDIERLNTQSQSHARLPKSMLMVVASKGLPLEKSSKGTILRSFAESRFREEIHGLYSHDRAPEYDPGKSGLPDDDVLPMRVLDIVKMITSLQDRIPDDADFFTLGVDSVACMQIRRLLRREILGSGYEELPLNVVYDCGNIRKLSNYLVDLRHGRVSAKDDDLQMMESMVREFGNFSHLQAFSGPSLVTPTSDQIKKSIILTGATGFLGAHVLAHLTSNPDTHLTLLVRGVDAEAAHARVTKALKHRKLPGLAANTTVLATHLDKPFLGLTVETYSSLAKSTDTIIHAAWPVNFNARLRSFTPALKGLSALLELAAKSKSRFVFCSSTASVLSPHVRENYHPIPERFIDDRKVPGPTGYARSKWVAEAVCAEANKLSALSNKVAVVRIGQLCGSTKTGVWNLSEAWPLMLSTLGIIGGLPDLKRQRLDWLPVDLAADAIAKIARTHEDFQAEIAQSAELHVFHLLNHGRDVAWNALLGWVAARRSGQFQTLTATEWVRRLEALSVNGTNHPALSLLDLWKKAYAEAEDHDHDDMTLETDETNKVNSLSMIRSFSMSEDLFNKIWTWLEEETASKGYDKSHGSQVPF